MQRREFFTVAGAIAGQYQARNAERRTRNRMLGQRFRVPTSDFRGIPDQEPALSPEVFARRLERARAELKTRSLDLLIATPSTNYEYFTGYNPGRSERLIALLLPVAGPPAIVCPSFEVERVKRHSVIAALHGWEEQEDPLALLRRAIAITLDAMGATFAQLAVGTTERDVAQILEHEMRQRGAPGDGLVQFGPSSALPHGGPGGPKLEREMVVLIDCGCRVGGYTSDITRTIWFGDRPSDEFRKVFNVVHDAQTAAMELGRPGTPCEEMDRAARRVITAAGYGPFFTHRLGHGLGMDGHEPEYLVEGNQTHLEPGMVFTIEPGIYQLGKFGVRIEDDCVMTATGVEVLSQRAVKL